MKKDTSSTIKKLYRILFFILVPVLILLVVKMLFVSFSPDEEYQIVMSYRLAHGGRLFLNVYDTVQTSGFLDAILIKFYIFLTGSTTGVVIFLRAAGLLIKGLVAFVFYKTARRYVSKELAAILSLVFFVTFPKMIASPDFSSLQLDFTVLMICFFDSVLFYCEKKKPFMEGLCIVLSALCLCGCILSTACFTMIPVALVFTLVCSKQNRLRRNLLFWLTCLVTGLLYCFAIVYQSGINDVITTVSGILSGDSTHGLGTNITGNSILVSFVKDSLLILCLLAVDALLSYLICVLLKKRDAFSAVFLNISFLFTLYFWFVKKTGYDGLKLFIPAIFIVSILSLVKNRQEKSQIMTPAFGVCAGVACFLNVLLISNVPLINNLSFLFVAVLFGMLAISIFAKENVSLILCTVFLSVSVAGSVFTTLSSPLGNTVFSYTAKISDGPAKGCLVDSFAADVYDKSLEAFLQNTTPEENVLLVTNCWFNISLTTLYMTNDVNISHYSVNSTPTYNSSLEDYWLRFPEYYPDCIIINNSTFSTWEWDWINLYIQNHFNFDRQIDTEYLTFFIKEK